SPALQAPGGFPALPRSSGVRKQNPGPGGYWSIPRNWTRSENSFGLFFASDSKDGIGAFGLRGVAAIADGRSCEPMWVRFGPGPLFPLTPIRWHAPQPLFPITSSPARNVAVCAAVRFDGGFSVTWFGEPTLAPE